MREWRDRGIDAWLSEDFAAHRLHVRWIPSEFARRRVIEAAALVLCLIERRRYRDYHRTAFGIIAGAPGSWMYKAGLVRLTLRKTGIHEVVRRGLRERQIVLSDNEATLQGAHHLFVHPGGAQAHEGLDDFAAEVPLPDAVIYLRAPVDAILERTLRRGHPRLEPTSLESARRVVRRTVEVFEGLARAPSLGERLLVLDPESVDDRGPRRGGETVASVLETLLGHSASAQAPHDPRHTPVGGDGPCLPDIVRDLLARLDGATYCHWKSNHGLVRASEENDLDLLVSAASLAPTRAVLSELGFREAVPASGPRAHGIWHYYGCDVRSGALVHVHLFGRVLTGESFIKSHRLPLDRMLLEDTGRLGPVRVPRKSAELVLFVLRTFIKYGSLPDLVRVARDRSGIQREYAWISSGCSVEQAVELLEEHCPAVDAPLFLRCLAALQNDRSLLHRMSLARRVRRRLRIHAVRGGLARLWAYGGFLGDYAVRRITRRGKGRVWSAGGAVVAFVGPDATGKSTLVSETARWLREAAMVRVTHLGKPRSCLRTWPLNAALRLARVVRGRGRRWTPPDRASGSGGDSPQVGWSAVAYGLRALALAVDRHVAVRRALRAAARGAVVVCDRYPTSEVGAMDGPRLEVPASPSGLRGRALVLFATLEHRLYESIPDPDILVQLTVSLETARRRNRDRDKADKHSDADLEQRHRSLGIWSTPESRRIEVSTEGTLEETLLRVRRALWSVF